MTRWFCATFLVLLTAAGLSAQARVIEVDCDAGGDLGEVLNRLAHTRPTGLALGENSDDADIAITINVSGTCVGNFVITTTGLIIQGAGPGPDSAVLQGLAPIQSVSPVVDIRGVPGVLLRNLTVTGGSRGIRAQNSTALVLDSEFRGNTTGVLSDRSNTTIVDSLLTDNSTGVVSQNGSFLAVYDCQLTDNTQKGAEAANASELLIDGGEVSGNLFGIRLVNNSQAFLRQPLLIGPTLGGAPITALNHSTVTLNDGVVVNSGSDAIEIVNNSLVAGFEAEIGADLLLLQFSHAVLRETAVDGDLQMSGFSNAILRQGAAVTGTASCDATSDADCSDGSVGAVNACDNCAVSPQ